MKKRIIYLVFWMLFLFLIIGFRMVFALIIVHGDVNGDGYINKIDASAIAKYIINNSVILDNFNSVEADVNGDGIVRVNDIIYIISYENQVMPATISLNQQAVGLPINNTYQLSNQLESKVSSWVSSNPAVATVNRNGLVTAISHGVSEITAMDNYGNKDTASIIVFRNNRYADFDSETFKYWIERPDNNYVVTRIWVEDAYQQLRVAMTNEVNSNIRPVKTWSSSYTSQMNRAAQINECINNPNRNYKMYNVMDANALFRNEIDKKGYQSKGMYGTNASPMISTYFGTSAPCDWFGTAATPIVINEGNIIRNSTNAKPHNNRSTVGLTRDGVLKSYSFKAGETDSEIEHNKQVVAGMISDGVRYTFANFGNLVANYKVKATQTAKSIRSAVCQIDEHNYILISSTVHDSSQSVRDAYGISKKFMAEEMVSYGCKTGYNLDGGGSQVQFHKTSTNNYTYVPASYGTRAYDGRGLADILYFVEK